MSEPPSPPGARPTPAEPARARTSVAVGLEAEYVKGQNLVWSAGMAIAWKELLALGGGPIVLAGAAAGDAGASIAAALNASPVDRSVVDDGSLVARAGFRTEALLRELREEMARKFAEPSPAHLPTLPAPELFMAYAYLQQRMAFELPLYRTSWPLHFRGGYVESFGLWRQTPPEDFEARTRQVRVHHPCYTEADVEQMTDAEYDVMYDEFVVELLTARPDDRLIVAMVRRGDTLAATVARAMSLLDRHGADHPQAHLDDKEKLEIPVVDLDLTRTYDELFGRCVENVPLRAQQFGEVVERVRFRLDEGGALLETEAAGHGLCLPPRELVCHSPFLVMVLRRGAHLPMFALWVDNNEILARAPVPELARGVVRDA